MMIKQFVFVAKSATLGQICVGSFTDYGDAFDIAAQLAQTMFDEAISFEFHEVKGINNAMQVLQQGTY